MTTSTEALALSAITVVITTFYFLKNPTAYFTTTQACWRHLRRPSAGTVWRRLPFGLSVSSEIFQKRVNKAIEGLSGVLGITDDILVYGISDTEDTANADHDRNLKALQKRCRERGIALNRGKLKLKRKEVTFTGHIFTSNGLKIDPDNVKAVVNMRKPEDVEGVQRLNYLAKFLPKLVDVMEPIRRLTRKETEWEWSDEQDKALEKIKRHVTTAPVLRYYDANSASPRDTVRREPDQFGSHSSAGGQTCCLREPSSHGYRDTVCPDRKRDDRHRLFTRTIQPIHVWT